MRAVAFIALLLCACAPKPAPPQTVALDCARGFEAMKAAILADPTLRVAPHTPDEPYRFYNSTTGAVSFLVTEPAAASHPAILEQRAGPGGLKDSGCAFGDKPAYDKLMAYLKSLGVRPK